MIRTALARASLITFVVVFSLVQFYQYSTKRIFNPTEWYGFSRGSDAGIDIRSPTKRAIAEIYFLPTPTFSAFAVREYRDRCRETDTYNLNGSNQYRGVMYCNSARLSGDELLSSFNYFKILVDGLYYDFYSTHLKHALTALLSAVSAIIALVIVTRLGRWVRAGA